MPEVDFCDHIQDRATGVWNINARTEMDMPVQIFEGKLAAAEAEYIVSQLDRFTVDWILLSEALCKPRAKENSDTPTDFQATTACLNDILAEQQHIIQALKSGNTAAAQQVDGLHPRLVQCYPEAYETIKKNPFGE
ncbi:MAG: hypothetical protein QNJ97_08180 [Myxococcota bacterium]|nr:hypothetical protein [Myxococcota bacterium]